MLQTILTMSKAICQFYFIVHAVDNLQCFSFIVIFSFQSYCGMDTCWVTINFFKLIFAIFISTVYEEYFSYWNILEVVSSQFYQCLLFNNTPFPLTAVLEFPFLTNVPQWILIPGNISRYCIVLFCFKYPIRIT